MDKTLRQEIAKEISDNCEDRDCNPNDLCDYCKIEVDRICTAIKAKVEEMPLDGYLTTQELRDEFEKQLREG